MLINDGIFLAGIGKGLLMKPTQALHQDSNDAFYKEELLHCHLLHPTYSFSPGDRQEQSLQESSYQGSLKGTGSLKGMSLIQAMGNSKEIGTIWGTGSSKGMGSIRGLGFQKGAGSIKGTRSSQGSIKGKGVIKGDGFNMGVGFLNGIGIHMGVRFRFHIVDGFFKGVRVRFPKGDRFH